MKIESSLQIFEKYSNINLLKNPSSWSQILPWGWTDGQTYMTKLIVAYRNFTKTSEN